MHAEIYRKLQEHLNLLPIGFPRTGHGAELEVLEHLFDQEEAGAFLHLSPAPETAEAIAARTQADPEKLAKLLERMAAKGLVLRSRSKGTYRMIPFMPGIYEFQLKRMDKELALAFEEVYPDLAREAFSSPTPFTRVVPVESSLPIGIEVLPYECASEVVRAAGTVALADCLCRKERKLVGGGCARPQDDLCIIFSPMAEQYVDLGLGKMATVEEALKAVRRGQDAGLVRTTLNVQSRPTFMCQCCSCCCGLLRGLSEFDIPTTVVRSRFIPGIEPELCNGCEACVQACPMDALTLVDEKAVLDAGRCIGCGLCVSECPLEAISLRLKPEPAPAPPANFVELMKTIALEKGKTYFYR
ncbi:MAG: 4Fe-4S binding protein [Chloroflexota bacterium]